MEARQLDIFSDALDVGLRNDLADALLRGDTAAARQGFDALRRTFADDSALAPAQRLIDHLEAQQGAVTVPDAAQLRLWCDDITQRMAPAAQAVFGVAAASTWLAAQWRWLAERALPLAWHPSQADVHAAALFLRAQAWQHAVDAAARIASWRRIPQPLLWVVQARWRLGQLDGADGAWALLAEALWLAPAQAAALIPQLGDARIAKIAKGFAADFDPAPADWAWLPAWALVQQPALSTVLDHATPPPSDSTPAEGYRLVAALLRLERQGRHRDIVEHRRQLQALSATLFSVYMRSR